MSPGISAKQPNIQPLILGGLRPTRRTVTAEGEYEDQQIETVMIVVDSCRPTAQHEVSSRTEEMTMKLSDLSPETRARIGKVRYDSFFEKHEGPWDWDGDFRYGNPEFLRIEDRYEVLLPVDQEAHRNLTVLRCHVSDDASCLTLFLKDTSYVTDPKFEKFETGRLAVCDRFPGEAFYVAIVYHEWFITF
jgi:hypothetical protein